MAQNMDDTLHEKYEPREMSTAALAFVGDAVFGLMTREYLCRHSRLPVGKLHKMSVDMVRCEGQAKAAERLLPILTEDETDYYMRGRNTHNSNTPRNASVADYRAATGLETLFGYLYLGGKNDRLRELFQIIRSGD